MEAEEVSEGLGLCGKTRYAVFSVDGVDLCPFCALPDEYRALASLIYATLGAYSRGRWTSVPVTWLGEDVGKDRAPMEVERLRSAGYIEIRDTRPNTYRLNAAKIDTLVASTPRRRWREHR